LKFFIDTANIEEIKKANDLGLIDGVTTNQTLIAREGKEFKPLLREICSIVSGPVSAEVISTECNSIVKEAKELASIHENIVVKIPLIPEGIKAVKILSSEGIKTNVTLCFSATQALLAAKAGATFVSPFVGRLDDISSNGLKLVKEIMQIYQNYSFNTKVIVASVRHPMHVLQAAKTSAHIVTCPFTVLMQLFQHPLTEKGLKKFLEDWNKLK
jgi:transaldolase